MDSAAIYGNEANAKMSGVLGDSMEKNIHIETHENVTITYETANIGSRFVADLMDTVFRYLIDAIIILIALFLIWDGKISLNFESSSIISGSLALAVAFVWLGLFLVDFLYTMLFEIITHGQTPGKMFMGLRVISATGEPATPLMIVLRNILRFFHSIPGGKFLDGIVVIFNHRSQRIGDLIAKTVVIKQRTNKKFKQNIDAIVEGIAMEKEVSEDEQASLDMAAQMESWKREMFQRINGEGNDKAAEDSNVTGENVADNTTANAADVAGANAAGNAKAESDNGAFFNQEEYEMLRTYLKRRGEMADYEKYDEMMYDIILKRSNATVPKFVTKARKYVFIVQAERFLRRTYRPDDNSYTIT